MVRYFLSPDDSLPRGDDFGMVYGCHRRIHKLTNFVINLSNNKVDWAAHLGGLISGFCVGMIVFSLDISKQIWKLFWLLSGIAITVVYFVVTMHRMYSGDVEVVDELRDVCGYYKQYFEDYECNCMRAEHQQG